MVVVTVVVVVVVAPGVVLAALLANGAQAFPSHSKPPKQMHPVSLFIPTLFGINKQSIL